jgi:hypothetical protein
MSDCQEVATAACASLHNASPFATESLGPRYNDPIAIAFRSKAWVHSRNTNVARCKMGNVGINRTKNMWRHSSRKTEVIEVALTAAVILEDWRRRY